MSHTRFALGFPLHKKIARLSDSAFRLWVSAMDRARSQGSDGHLEPIDLDLVPHCPKTGPKRVMVVGEIVAAGLWEVSGDGWQIHDYLDWQDSSQRVVTRRQRAREHMRVVRKGVRANKDAHVSEACATDASSLSSPTSGFSDPSQPPDPDSDPDLSGRQTPAVSRGPDRFARSFETPVPEQIQLTQKHRDLCRTRDLDPDDERAKHRAWARSNGRQCLDWGADLELWILRTRPIPAGQRRRPNGRETDAEKRTREQLERVAALEAEELAETERKAASE